MPTRLRKVKFTRDLLPRVQDFFCGDQQPWETEAAAWIKSPAADSPHDCAVLAVEQCAAQVWLHELEDGTIVGYSSLGPSGWRIPPPNGRRTEISVIPWMAIQKQFWGCPADADVAEKYSAYLMDDVIAEARRIQHDNAPILDCSFTRRTKEQSASMKGPDLWLSRESTRTRLRASNTLACCSI